MEWKPISQNDLHDLIYDAERNLIGELLNFWQLIQIDPTKWKEETYGTEGGGFWVVAICGKRVIWFNEIEKGFNISDYKTHGEIDGYYCNQDELHVAVSRLFELVKLGGSLTGQAVRLSLYPIEINLLTQTASHDARNAYASAAPALQSSNYRRKG